MAADEEPYQLLERVFREEAGRLTASLVRQLGDFDLAEELVSAAVVEALEHWPHDGVPERPAQWLLTTARHKGIDRLRREAAYRTKLEAIASVPREPPREIDDRLRLIFICCHPVLGRDAQIALTLRAVVGLTTEEIARAFMVPGETLVKRIVRAKHKIVASGVPYRIPPDDELVARLDGVLSVVYLIFNEGYLATAGPSALRRDLASDAEWLATLLVRLLPDEPEPLALLAIIRLHLARWPARLDADGRLVLLERQDRTAWDRRAITNAVKLIERAKAFLRLGRYQIEAMIVALHSEADSWAATDWPRVLALYSLLTEIDPSPVVRLNRAIALRFVDGPLAGLREVDELAEALSQYHLFHATRAAFLRDLGRHREAAQADVQALALTKNAGERVLLEDRLALAGGSTRPPGGAAQDP